MTKFKKFLLVLAGMALFVSALTGFLWMAFYVPLRVVEVVLVILGISYFSLWKFFPKKYEKWKLFVKDLHWLYYLMEGVGIAFVLIIIAFVSAIIYGVSVG